MNRWEYAVFYFSVGRGKKRFVTFSQGKPWEPIAENEFMTVLSRLGTDGWELVSSAIEGDQAEAWYFKRPVGA
jgi:hypothetical protein